MAICSKCGLPKLNWKLLNGDARQLSGLLTEQGYCEVVSPPYYQSGGEPDPDDDTLNRNGRSSCRNNYNLENPNNIGNLKDTPLVGITSPPYQDMAKGDPAKQRAGWEKLAQDPNSNRYNRKSHPLIATSYNLNNSANIGNLLDKQLIGITSPPYENADVNGARKMPEGYWDRCDGIGHTKTVGTQIENPNNIGSQTNESYLSAILQVYSEAYRSGISPLVLVTKNPTRNGKLRDLAGDTVSILQQAGYEIFDYHRAILFKEVTQDTLDGESFTKPKGRLSFFKRLSYDKGNVVARWEDVIFARIPDRSGYLIGIISPPYAEAQMGNGIAIKGYRGKHIHEMGKNQPNKVGDRCGYMKARHGSNPENIGNLPDKPKQILNTDRTILRGEFR